VDENAAGLTGQIQNIPASGIPIPARSSDLQAGQRFPAISRGFGGG
jgi:hypothetical protein